MNLTGSGVEGIGGLTMVILGFMTSMVMPAIWWFVVGGISAGSPGIVIVEVAEFCGLNTEARRHDAETLNSQIGRFVDW